MASSSLAPVIPVRPLSKMKLMSNHLFTSQAVVKLRRVRWLTALFMAGLIISGVTAIPLTAEVDALVQLTGAEARLGSPDAGNSPAWAVWLLRIQTALHATTEQHPPLFYGTDWLAFGHIVIALVFVGAWRDPVQNRWLFDFGLIACALVIPWALLFGELRGIPLWWRLIDCSFGVLGALPLLLARKLTQELAYPSPRHEPNRLVETTA